MIAHNLIISLLLLFLSSSSTVLALPTSTINTAANTTPNATHPSIHYFPRAPVEYATAFIGPREEGPKTYCTNYGPVVDQTSAASPLSVDCKQIAINIGAGGSWKWITGPKPKIVAKYGTCLVGVDGASGVTYGNYLRVGNMDIVWMIEETLKLPFYNGEKVGSKGTMDCKQVIKPDRNFAVTWGVWHT